jgi:putative flippase GtrA
MTAGVPPAPASPSAPAPEPPARSDAPTLARLKGLTVRAIRFYTVGAIGIGVQLAVLALLAGLLQIHYLLATLLAVEVAILHNFGWHERWTWADRTRLVPEGMAWRLVRFNVTTGAVSLLGNVGIMWLLVGRAHLHYFTANIITIAACAIINFLVSDRYVFFLNRSADDRIDLSASNSGRHRSR